MNFNYNKIINGAILSYISIILNIVSGLFYVPWMIRMIGTSQYALFTLVNSLITLFMVDFGLSSAVTRYISKYRSLSDEKQIDNFLGIIYRVYISLDALLLSIFIILYYYIDYIYSSLTYNEIIQLKVVYLIAGLFSVISFPFMPLNGILTAYEEFFHLKLADILYRVLSVGVMIVALIMGYGLYALVSINAFIGIITILYKIYIITKKTSIAINFGYKCSKLSRDIFKFSAWTTISNLAQRLVFTITPTILGIVSNSSEIAIFGIVATIEGYIFTVTTALNGMFMPTVSKMYSLDKENNTEVSNLFIKVGKIQYIINSLIIVGFICTGKSFIELWLGKDYQVSYFCIIMVIIPGLFYNSLQIANTALIVLNKVKIQALISTVMGLINIPLSYVLSKHYGVIGACISISFSLMVRNILLNLICYFLLRFNMINFFKDCYFRLGILAIISIGIFETLNLYLSVNGWIMLIFKMIMISIIFLTLVFCLGLNNFERKFVLCKVAKGRNN